MVDGSQLRLVDDSPPVVVDPSVEEAFLDFVEDGVHPEYDRFEELIPKVTSITARGRVLGPVAVTDAWKFIDDAVEGTGGFCDGGYLVPHLREFNREAGQLDEKFVTRRLLAPYDNFVKPITTTPWNYIVEHRDLVLRKILPELPEEYAAALRAFWGNADGRRSSMMSFLTYPASQARRFGTGWILVDRPATRLDNRTIDLATPVYAYGVPTKDVVWWEFDEDFRLAKLIVREPWIEAAAEESVPYDVRVWTREGWGLYRPRLDAKGTASAPSGSWVAVDGGPNELGEVPAVQLFDEDPGPGRGFGGTVIPAICKVAMTTYNQDSEIREIQRNCGFPILGVPLKDVTKVKELQLGTENILGWDGSGSGPAWITQALVEAAAIAEDRDAKKQAAYATAHMAAITGWIETESGFHAEVEFDRTNRRIGNFAASVEDAENKIARLVLRWRGWPNDEQSEQDLQRLVGVSYPRDYGIRNWDAMLRRLETRLNLVLGEADATEAILDYYTACYPRTDKDTLRQKATEAAAARYKATGGGPAAQSPTQGAMAMSGTMPAQTPGSSASAMSARLAAALAAKGRKPALKEPISKTAGRGQGVVKRP